MTHSYTINGLTCEGCVASVKSKLLMHPDVQAAAVTLADKKAVITMQKHLSVAQLQAAIGKDSKYTISANTIDHGNAMETRQVSQSWLATYKPLLIIAGFTTGVSFLTSGGSLQIAADHFMAGFFLVFSFFKFLDLRGFASTYSKYDIVARNIPGYGYVYPFIELGLGLSYLTGFNLVATNWVTVIVMGVSSVGVIQSVLNKQEIQCACLGSVFNLPMSTVTIIEDLLMAGMSAAMLF